MAKHAHGTASAAPASVTTAPWINGSMLEAMTRMGEVCTGACQTWQQEITRFATARYESDNDLARRLMTCGNWTEAARLQQDWAGTMMQDYLNQTNRMVQLAATLGAELMAAEPTAGRSRSSGRDTQAAA
jgi:hypothetical protein